MEGSHMTLCMSKCDKHLNTGSAGKVNNNHPCIALSCDPVSLKCLNTNSAWNVYNPKPSHDQSCNPLSLENRIYKSYKYCMSKCDKRLNTYSAGKVQKNKPCNAQTCDPISLKSLNTNSAWNAYNP